MGIAANLDVIAAIIIFTPRRGLKQWLALDNKAALVSKDNKAAKALIALVIRAALSIIWVNPLRGVNAPVSATPFLVPVTVISLALIIDNKAA